MATKARKSTGTKKKRAPFIDRFNKRVAKFAEWTQKMTPKFASEPKGDVADALGSVEGNLVTLSEAVSKLNGWAPPTRSQGFAVGDSVVFKKNKIDELVKAGLYSKEDLAGEHEVIAVAGRKVKLTVGLFQNLYVTKSA